MTRKDKGSRQSLTGNPRRCSSEPLWVQQWRRVFGNGPVPQKENRGQVIFDHGARPSRGHPWVHGEARCPLQSCFTNRGRQGTTGAGDMRNRMARQDARSPVSVLCLALSRYSTETWRRSEYWFHSSGSRQCCGVSPSTGAQGFITLIL